MRHPTISRRESETETRGRSSCRRVLSCCRVCAMLCVARLLDSPGSVVACEQQRLPHLHLEGEIANQQHILRRTNLNPAVRSM